MQEEQEIRISFDVRGYLAGNRLGNDPIKCFEDVKKEFEEHRELLENLGLHIDIEEETIEYENLETGECGNIRINSTPNSLSGKYFPSF
ncbi:MAG: hypothetical protein AAF316_00070 [Cyanobacteria bacterium P01_A01_bin.80]